MCINTASCGLCAERSAIAAMATAGKSRTRRMVAVWCDERDGRLFVLIDGANLATEHDWSSALS